MPSKILSAIRENQIIVFEISKKNYIEKTYEIIAEVSNKHDNICYVTLNRPYQTMLKDFAAKKIDSGKFTFIDAVSGGGKNSPGVIFVQSPKSLTDISIDMSNLLGKKTESFIFDSLSTLLIYSDSMTSIKFVHSIVSKIRAASKKCIFMSLKEDSGTDMMKDINMFVDKIVPY
ncbi:MAG: hypothetical protein HY833_03805 [Candidatus Aenigmarchaeota archaeon]|nr:hypothetical protein [Candidatus Aenigmarchaeota archaeon]